MGCFLEFARGGVKWTGGLLALVKQGGEPALSVLLKIGARQKRHSQRLVALGRCKVAVFQGVVEDVNGFALNIDLNVGGVLYHRTLWWIWGGPARQ